MNEDIKQRLGAVRRELTRTRVQALLVTDMVHVRYLSGFTGSIAMLIITPRSRRLLTDSRYVTQAKKEATAFKLVQVTWKAKDIAKQARALGITRLAFEPEGMTHKNFLEVRPAMKGIKLVPFGDFLHTLRSKKSAREARLIKKAARIASSAFNDTLPRAKPGIRERDFALALETRMQELGSGQPPFPTIVASGKRGALPHGIASDKKIKKGELVTVDFGSAYQGYQSDQTVTFCMGRAKARQIKIYETVRVAQEMATAAIRPGARCKDVDKVARGYIAQCGFGEYFGHGLGHGVGLGTHEGPVLNPMSETTLEPGMVVTVEPGIYIPGWGGVRIEDMVIVTNKGRRLLTGSGGEIRQL